MSRAGYASREHHRKLSRLEGAEPPGDRSHTLRVLVVEDEPKVACSVETALREEAHDVDVAYDGAQGLTVARGGDHDLMILAVMLPGESALEIVPQLRAEGKSAPIFFLTAPDSTDDIVQGLNAGADDYLTKPFHLEDGVWDWRARSYELRKSAAP